VPFRAMLNIICTFSSHVHFFHSRCLSKNQPKHPTLQRPSSHTQPLKPMASFVGPVRRVSSISAADDEEEEDNLEKEPGPAAAALRNRRLFPSAASRGRTASRLRSV